MARLRGSRVELWLAIRQQVAGGGALHDRRHPIAVMHQPCEDLGRQADAVRKRAQVGTALPAGIQRPSSIERGEDGRVKQLSSAHGLMKGVRTVADR